MRKWVLPLLLVLELVAFAPYCGVRFDSTAGFLQSTGRFGADLCAQAAPLAILVLGMTIVLMTAGIDLSVGSVVALVACVMSTFSGGPAFWWTAVPLGLLLAMALGGFNGALIAKFDVPPIIATLGTMFLYRGACEIVMGDRENAPFADVPGYMGLGGFPGSMILAALLLLAGGAYFHRSRWRREILMIGGNRVAARYAGIPVDRRICQVYATMSLLAFAAALCFTARDGSVKASSFEGLELQVIVATVLGGTPVSGGAGSIVGSVLGVFLITVLNEALRGLAAWRADALGFKITHLEYLLMGALLVLGVWLNTHIKSGGTRRGSSVGRENAADSQTPAA